MSLPNSFDSVNPARPAEVIGAYSRHDANAVDRAVEVAAEAQRAWAKVPVPARADSERMAVDGGLSANCFRHDNPDFAPTSLATLAGGQMSPIQPPNDGFFDPATFIGAVPPPPDDDWTQGWTSYPQR